nr:HPr family phosphocarrier protein [Shewanella sp. NFH-SH190041]
MCEATVTISARHGLHTRPAAIFVKTARNFQSEIELCSEGKCANGKSLFKMLTLGLSLGTQVTLRAKGDDAPQAIAILSHLMETLQ